MSLPITCHTNQFGTLGQIDASHLAEIVKQGYKSVINNRPDGEGGPSQPSHSEIKAAADAVGLHYVYQPVISSQMTMDDVHRFHEHLEALPKPVLAFCRTGTRCTRLFQARYACTESALGFK